MSKRSVLLILVAFAAVLASSWLTDQWQARQGKDKKHRPEQQVVDYFLSGVDATRLDAEGHKRYHLLANRIDHYSNESGSMITAPVLTLFDEEQQVSWIVSADNATMDEPGIHVAMHGNVVARQPEGVGSHMRLDTEKLLLDTEREFAETDLAVRLRNRSSDTVGIGMNAYLKEQRVELLDQVRGIHVPASQ